MNERREVLVDTGAWLAISADYDQHHRTAVAALQDFLRESRPLITTNLVVAESYTLILRAGGHAQATAFVESLHETDRIRVVYSSDELERRAYQILVQYADQDFSYVDAVSFAFMRQNNISNAFAFDRHFVIAGFVTLPTI